MFDELQLVGVQGTNLNGMAKVFDCRNHECTNNRRLARYSNADIADLILRETTHATIFVKGEGKSPTNWVLKKLGTTPP
jgi:hypothetical protein